MILWWYVAKQFLKSFVGVLLFSLTLYFVLTYMEESQRYFPKFNPQPVDVFLFYIWQFPTVLVHIMPFAALISGIVTNWILAKHGEIAAMRASSMSMMTIAKPLVIVGMFLVLMQFAVSEFVIPITTNHFQKVRDVLIEKRKVKNPFMESKWLKAGDSVLHFKKYNEEDQQLLNVEYFKYMDENSFEFIVHATTGYFDSNASRWVLCNALVTHFDKNQKLIFYTEVRPRFVTQVEFAPPRVLKRESESSQLSFWDLKKLIDEAELVGANITDRVIDLHMKLSMPFANLLFVFLTIPFALKKERQEENYYGIIICIIAALIYWFGNMTLRSYAIKGVLNSYVAAWAMNVLIALLSYLLIRKLDKGQ